MGKTEGVALSLMCLAAVACASGPQAGETTAFTRLAPAGLADSQSLWGYSQVIVVEPGARTIYVAGTTGDDETGQIVDPGDFERQVDRTFHNIETSLAAAGASGTDVVRLRLYVVNFDAERHWPIIGAAMLRHFGPQGPTATLVGVQALAEPSILFEADATAAVR